VEEKLIELRQRQIMAIPAHVTHWVMIDQVDKILAETLVTIYPKGDVEVMGEVMAVHISYRESHEFSTLLQHLTLLIYSLPEPRSLEHARAGEANCFWIIR
jgi:hypothetical protein